MARLSARAATIGSLTLAGRHASLLCRLEMLLGNDIVTPEDEEPSGTVSEIDRLPKLAHIYKGSAKNIAPREEDDPLAATHRFAGKTVRAWGGVRGARA